MYGGKNSMFIRNGHAKNGTAIANRDSIISATWMPSATSITLNC
jgi:hypothetical protein